MAIVLQGGASGVSAEVGGSTFRALHTHVKPLEYGSLGHYRYSTRIATTAAQAANSRFFEIRNSHASNLIIPTSLRIQVLQTAAGTAQENSFDVYKCTSFTAIDTTNTTTPTISVLRTGMAAAPGGAVVRTLNPNTAGMTGGTLTKDTSPLITLPLNVQTAAQATPAVPWIEVFPLSNLGYHPVVFAQNEGLIIENRVLNVTSYGCTLYIDFSWAEVSAF